MCIVPGLKNGFIFSFLSLLIECLENSLQKWLEKIIFGTVKSYAQIRLQTLAENEVSRQ